MNESNSSVKKNFFYQCLYEILVIILPLVTSPYIARVLGVEKIGIYSYTYTIANYFVLFACLGVKNYGNRTIAAVRDNQEELNRTFSNIFAIMVLVSGVVSVVYVGYIVFLSNYKKIAIIQFLYVLSCFFDINWFYFGIEKFKLTVSRNTVIKLGTVAAIFLFVKSEEDLWIYCLIMALGTFISQLVIWFFLKNYVKFTKPSWTDMVPHIKPLFVLFIPVLAVSLYKYMDKIMLGMLSTKTQVGLYENAEKAINIPTSIITAFGTVMLPKMSNLAKNGNFEKINDYINKTSEVIMCIACALTFGMMGVAENFSVVFWGKEFEPCGKVIIVLSITIPFLTFANVIRTQFLIPQKMDKPYIISVFAGAGINLVANSILIHFWGALGAAYGTVLAEVTVCILQSFFVSKKLPILKFVKNFLFFIIVGVVMLFVVCRVGRLGIQISILLIQILTGGMFYIFVCLVYFKATNNKLVMGIIHSALTFRKRDK